MTTQLESVFIARSSVGEADLQATVNLINACDAIDQLDQSTSVEELRLEFADPDFDVARDIRLWEDAQGQLSAYGLLWVPPDINTEGYLSFKIHPQARDKGIEAQVLAWAQERMEEANSTLQRPVILRSGARESQRERIVLLEQYGFTIDRYFYRMTLPLNNPDPIPQLPVGYEVRSLQPDEVDAWVDLFNQSFIDHWNFHPETREQRQYWMSGPEYCADLDLVAVSPEGTFAAFCLSSIYTKANARTGRHEGWISSLGTRRGFRKMGLGRAMLLNGIHHLKAKGVETVLLGVDAENPSGALRLYKSVGFCKLFASHSYCKQIIS